MTSEYAAAVIGGGPAGTAAAITLSRLGHRVLLIDESREADFKVGEVLAPAVRPLLRQLGMMDLFLADGHLPCYGNVSAWGGDEPHTTDFVFNPHGHGWHLDRLRFEAMLRGAAREAGSALSQLERFTGAERVGDRWRVTLRAGNSSREVFAAWLIDATGRRAAVSRRLGASRIHEDRLIAYYVRFLSMGVLSPDRDARTLVEAAPDGWWYTSLLPSGERIVAYLTDSDLADRALLSSPEGFSRLLTSTRHVSRMVIGRQQNNDPRGAVAGSSKLDQCGGERWLAVGDAALSFDPLSSQGILNALYCGIQAAQAISDSLAGNPNLVIDYLQSLDEIYGAYRVNLKTYYAAEGRWRDRPFWRRRTIVG